MQLVSLRQQLLQSGNTDGSICCKLHYSYLGIACRDLLEVCEAQLQFGTKAELPVFGGARGPDISKSITDIQVGLLSLLFMMCPQSVFTSGHIGTDNREPELIGIWHHFMPCKTFNDKHTSLMLKL